MHTNRTSTRLFTALLTVGSALILGGCTRSQMNYQIAEAIGTTGKYAGNEPVETPQMAENRLQKEESESEADSLQAVLDEASGLADSYLYEEAIASLNTLTGPSSRDQKVSAAREDYENREAALVNWDDGPIPHLCFPTLIADPSLAFDGDSKAQTYDQTMLTTDEFKSILDSLYSEQYILIDMQSIAALSTDDRGTTTMDSQTLKLPDGKKPLVLSQDNLTYADVSNGDGIATCLVLDDDGKVKARYTDKDGHDQTGDYDFIPILDSFIEQHPDFSFRGARGIVSVSGSNGIYGYRLPDDNTSDTGKELTEDETQIKAISSALTAEGWHIACAGWTHSYMNEMSADAFKGEMDSWINLASPLVGKSDTLFYPYGAEVSYPGDNLTYLLDNGFVYLCGLWGDTDYRELGDGYMRMTRRFIDGYTLQNAPNYFTDFFDAKSLVDDDR